MVKIIDKGDSIRQMFLDAIGRFRQNATMEEGGVGVLERLLSSGNRGLVMTERQIIAMGAGGRGRKDGPGAEHGDL